MNRRDVASQEKIPRRKRSTKKAAPFKRVNENERFSSNVSADFSSNLRAGMTEDGAHIYDEFVRLLTTFDQVRAPPSQFFVSDLCWTK